VAAFLGGEISWPGIAAVVAEVLDQCEQVALREVEDVLEADRRAREKAVIAVGRWGQAA
jgi:1-deoxy-D-xylulose 5-phosphate reductoisomerase